MRQFQEQRGHALIQIQDAVMVVAHPDDEIIWFSSILDQCRSVLVCFGPSANSKRSWDSGRAALMESYPLTKVRFLKLRQSNSFDAADWAKPTETRSGLQLRRRTRSAYAANAEELLHILEAELKHQTLVFTHNPWGEYGHEEHVQVFRILSKLKDKLGFDLYVDSYVSNKSASLMSTCLKSLEGHPLVRETNRPLAHRLKNQYLDNDCWTWTADYEWPEYESFYRVIKGFEGIGPPLSASVPLNYITGDFNRSLARKIARKAIPTSLRAGIKRALNIE
jgi:LmbE family N-acetylglucosaminyl deacetylase